ncbi:PLP-dependent transferase [Rozella allomycis CSF55]|uniref:PLP-dependent transferase n=1 Tax=Rozella allomycis (strain CSF55) TaxID=988480 RepID=A0A075AUD2_ROZAC|nr:Pyridoxal phosphate-dependent transferase domain-containing protein 3 [Rozella allomycis CSF55]RKP19826.1 PLP-dependent transferase [Rozella allomycis CSF55]|eukprot:EPZ33878.1 Pyridoxal phosphate-dependent transferase domain-containing protein 3 [Rozella allomycis CSF55]
MMISRKIDYSKYLNSVAKLRQPSAIRALQPLLLIPGMFFPQISLGGGSPDPNKFPIDSISFSLKSGETIKLDRTETKRALQYSNTLLEWLRELQNQLHRPKSDDWSMCVTNGSQDGAFEMFLTSEDSVLLETPTYSGTLAVLRPIGCRMVEIHTNKNGICPNALKEKLSNWDASQRRPKILYTVPNGGNPTGCSTNLQQRLEVLKLAEEYDFLIIEDDPYYYLQYNYNNLIPSYFSLDQSGRVLRFDSFSKILSAGARIGFASGPKALIDRIILHEECSNIHPCGISQSILLKLLKTWGHNGFLDHCKQTSQYYESKKNLFLEASRRHLGNLVSFNEPKCGMFIWMKILGIVDSESLVKEKAIQEKEFMPHGDKSPFLRAAFSTATEEEIDTALLRLGKIIKICNFDEDRVALVMFPYLH